MFASSLNLFKNVPCPTTRINGEECNIPFCIFKHEKKKKEVKKIETRTGAVVRKKRRIADRETEKQDSTQRKAMNDEGNATKGKKLVREKPESPVIVSEESAFKLTPKPVTPFNPALLQQRVQHLKTIHRELVDSKSTNRPKIDAVAAEFEIASKSTTVTYPVNIRKLIADIRAGRYKNKEELEKQAKKEAEKTEDNELRKLILSVDILERRKYIVSPPSSSEIPSGFTTKCQRCGTIFDTTKKIKTSCKFHLLRREYDPQKGKRSDIFPCCSQPIGESNGCEMREFHVWKIDEPELLTGIIPFARTPNYKTEKTRFAVGLDCEMGYTTFGMELIRLTVVDWRTRENILDRYVYPYGEILDLNTRFSGISDISHGTTDTDGTKNPTITFKQARELLFEYVNAQTIIIGHGLENDLNSLRLIHHRVVDTAILYPSLKETRTYSLKQLSFKYLGKIIQLGEHDSSEDSLAAIDIVKENIKRTLQEEKK